MATAVARGQRRANAITRIEQSCQALAGGGELHLPTVSRYGAEMLNIFQLEAIADFLESATNRATPASLKSPKPTKATRTRKAS